LMARGGVFGLGLYGWPVWVVGGNNSGLCGLWAVTTQTLLYMHR
jgi:hypothetical protein